MVFYKLGIYKIYKSFFYSDKLSEEAQHLGNYLSTESAYTGVITKPDRVDSGAEQDLIDMLTNKKLSLAKGYVCVKCRSQKELDGGMTLQESLAAEQKFFASSMNKHFK